MKTKKNTSANGAPVNKWRTRHKILFDGRVALDVTVVSMAMMGMSTKAIAQETGLSLSQVSYRILKAQHGEGIEKGYRYAWRNGTSPYCLAVKNTLLPRFGEHVRTSLPKLFVTPPVETGKEKR